MMVVIASSTAPIHCLAGVGADDVKLSSVDHSSELGVDRGQPDTIPLSAQRCMEILGGTEPLVLGQRLLDSLSLSGHPLGGWSFRGHRTNCNRSRSGLLSSSE